MANGNAILNGTSDWTSLKAWSQAIGIIGIPGAIAFWLVYTLSTELPRISRQQEVIIAESQQLRIAVTQLTQVVNGLSRTARQACYNAAKDDNARQRCFDP